MGHFILNGCGRQGVGGSRQGVGGSSQGVGEVG